MLVASDGTVDHLTGQDAIDAVHCDEAGYTICADKAATTRSSTSSPRHARPFSADCVRTAIRSRTLPGLSGSGASARGLSSRLVSMTFATALAYVSQRSGWSRSSRLIIYTSASAPWILSSGTSTGGSSSGGSRNWSSPRSACKTITFSGTRSMPRLSRPDQAYLAMATIS